MTMDKRAILGIVILDLGTLIYGSVGWVALTAIAHGQQLAETNARLNAVESSDSQIRTDLRYIRARVDELVDHLL